MDSTMHKTAILTIALAAALSGSQLSAAPAPATGVLGGQGPIDFTGGPNSEVSNENCRVVLANPARVTQGLVRLTGQRIVLTGAKAGDECAFNRVEATGNVYYVTSTQRLRADSAVYNERDASAVFTGDVVIARGQDVLTFPSATLNTTTGATTFPGGLRGVSQPATRGPAAP